MDKLHQKKAEDTFHKLKKLFLGAINTLDEDAILQVLREGQTLISSGHLDLNKPIKDTQSTFLHTAVWFRKLEIIKFLVLHGADPNRKNLKGNTPLHFAVSLFFSPFSFVSSFPTKMMLFSVRTLTKGQTRKMLSHG